MKQVYQSKDGKIFNTEQECIEYEKGAIFGIDYIILDMNYREDKDNIHPYYISIKTEKGIEYIRKHIVGDFYSFDENKIGNFYWCFENRHWNKIDDGIKNLKYDIEDLEKAKNIFNNYK